MSEKNRTHETRISVLEEKGKNYDNFIKEVYDSISKLDKKIDAKFEVITEKLADSQIVAEALKNLTHLVQRNEKGIDYMAPKIRDLENHEKEIDTIKKNLCDISEKLEVVKDELDRQKVTVGIAFGVVAVLWPIILLVIKHFLGG